MGSPPPTRFHLVGQLTIFSPDAIWATFSLLNKSIWEGIPEGSPFLLSIVQINPPWNSGTIFTSKKGQNLFGQGVPPIWKSSLTRNASNTDTNVNDVGVRCVR